MAEEEEIRRKTLADFQAQEHKSENLGGRGLTPNGGVAEQAEDWKPIAHSETNRLASLKEPRLPGGPAHYWKVTLDGETAVPGTFKWIVAGNNVFTQGMTGSFTLLEEVEGAGIGYILLKITRDTASREATAFELVFSAAVTTSTEAIQYRPIALVNPDGDEGVDQVVQMQFEEIRIWELMIVQNGEFELMGAEMSHRNTYVPPP